MTPIQFIQKYASDFIDATSDTPLFPSVKMAQAAIETGWGKSTIGDAKNLFGIKGRGAHTPYWKGDIVYKSTKEFINGQMLTTTEPFRKYKSFADSIRDHSHLLLNLSRYKPVLQAQTPEEQAAAIHNAGYATDPGYTNKLLSIINQYNLKTVLDSKKKQ